MLQTGAKAIEYQAASNQNAYNRMNEPKLHKRGLGRHVAEIGVIVAFSCVLGFLSFSMLPNGGQVSLDMIPILVLARLRGLRSGLIAAFAYGFLHFFQEPVIIHPLQAFLDYPLAFGVLGLAGLGASNRRWDIPACLLAMVSRFCCHTLAGVLFVDMFMPKGQIPASPLTYSAGYNLAFLGPSIVLCLVILPFLLHSLRKTRFASYLL